MSRRGSPRLVGVGVGVGVGTLVVLVIGCSGDRDASRNATGSSNSRPSASSTTAGGSGSRAGSAGVTSTRADAGSRGSAGSAATPASVSGSAAAGASAKPSAALDPNLHFDWPESSPGNGNSCQAGTYTGTFDCVFTDPSGLIPSVELSGPVSLTFAKSMDGEFLEISQGNFEALGNLIIGGKAKIEGKLDCNTLMLNAMAVDGEWTFGDPEAPLIPGGGLEGEIMGTLDPTTGTLSGQWSFADPTIGACPGTWSVMYAP